MDPHLFAPGELEFDSLPLPPPDHAHSVVRKLHRNVLSLFVAVVVLCYIDRTSLAFAALQLCQQSWFNAATFGLGSGIFYLGYVVFQVPSNLILRRVGAPCWLGCIIIAWGLVAVCCATISSTASFYSLRLALGVAEAGAFPGMWYVLAHFYPQQHITLPYAVLEACVAVSQVVAAPVAALILQMDGLAGLQGWQWLFVTEGCMTVLLGALLMWRLPASIADAAFLSLEERLWLQQQQQSSTSSSATDAVSATAAAAAPSQARAALASSPRQADEAIAAELGARRWDAAAPGSISGLSSVKGTQGSANTLQLLQETAGNRRIWHLSGIKVLKDVSLDGLLYWTPSLIHTIISGQVNFSSSSSHKSPACSSTHSSSPSAVLLTAVPFTLAAAAAVAIGHSSQVHSEQRWHICLPLIVGGCVFCLMPALVQLSIVLGFLCLTAALVAADATTGPLWTWVQAASQGETVAISLAFVNSLGKLGGFFGPFMFGLLVHWTGSFMPSVLLIGGVQLAAGLLAWRYGADKHHSYSQLQETELAVE